MVGNLTHLGTPRRPSIPPGTALAALSVDVSLTGPSDFLEDSCTMETRVLRLDRVTYVGHAKIKIRYNNICIYDMIHARMLIHTHILYACQTQQHWPLSFPSLLATWMKSAATCSCTRSIWRPRDTANPKECHENTGTPLVVS